MTDWRTELEEGNPTIWSGFLGVNVPVEEAVLVLIPVPWEGTVTYGKGTAGAPKAICEASSQLDVYDMVFGKPYMAGITMLDIDKKIARMMFPHTGMVNECSSIVNSYVNHTAKELIAQGKMVGVVGGEHSSPYGLISALTEKYPTFGILHIDAHMDLRVEYQGHAFSHASIMHNVMKFENITKLVQVGVRDFSFRELEASKALGDRCLTIWRKSCQSSWLLSAAWEYIVECFLEKLPEHVYISFDIDGLDPSCCPTTGTPVPGGLSYNEAIHLIEEVGSKKKIIGFDLCEVGREEYDANVGARILYKLCGAMLHSNKAYQLEEQS